METRLAAREDGAVTGKAQRDGPVRLKVVAYKVAMLS